MKKKLILKIPDKIVGRPIRLNRQNLSVGKGKDYAEVIFIGDVHLGSPQFDKKRFEGMIDFCVKNNVYVFLMGDWQNRSPQNSDILKKKLAISVNTQNGQYRGKS